MKKCIALIFFSCLIQAGALPCLSEALSRGLSMGLNFGGSSVFWSYHTYSVGAEVGYRLTEQIGMRAEFDYASLTSSFQSEGTYYFSSGETTYTLMPVSLIFLFVTPLNKGLSAYLGLGGGYCSFSVKEKSEELSLSLEPIKIEENYKLKALAPYVCFGFEATIFKRLGIFAESSYFIGKDQLVKKEDALFSTEQDVNFGGPQIKIGMRFYFKS